MQPVEGLKDLRKNRTAKESNLLTRIVLNPNIQSFREFSNLHISENLDLNFLKTTTDPFSTAYLYQITKPHIVCSGSFVNIFPLLVFDVLYCECFFVKQY